jgi:NAD(P)-dependent dehydrogenase (short-subunit alcohol dehydrogenase family)
VPTLPGDDRPTLPADFNILEFIMLLSDKICLVVGAGSERGIGFATALLFAQHGARVVGCDLVMDDERAQALKDRISEETGRETNVEFLRADIANREDCAMLVNTVKKRFGRLDSVVNCAGIVSSRPTLDVTEDEVDRMFEINLKGAFNVCQSALAAFAEQGNGSIVNVASVAAQRGGGLVGSSHYAASKGGVISLTRSIAREFGPMGIRANIVCPSMTETGMLDGNVSESMYEQVVAGIPLRRAGRAVDIAGACLFLASDLSAYVTGATIDVNGGSHIH